jgi:hypothetical protein
LPLRTPPVSALIVLTSLATASKLILPFSGLGAV